LDNVDAVVVYSLDRFSRDPVHGVILMQELEKHDVSLEAATETVDNSEVGKLVFYIKGYAAKLDAERRRDATGRGKQAMLKQGKLPQGTGIGIYGYEWDKETQKRIPIEHEAAIVKRVFEMVAEGNSCHKTARLLNSEGLSTKTGRKWEARTINQMVINSAYCGLTYFGKTTSVNGKVEKVKPELWTLLPDITPAIVSKELFDQVQDALALSRELHPAGRAKHEYLLKGHIVCGYCGSPLVGSCLRGNYRYYHCRGTYPTSSRDKICDARYIKADWLENIAWDNVKNVLSEPELLLSEVQKQTDAEQTRAANGNLNKEIKRFKRKLKSYAGQERRLINLLRMEVATPDTVLDEINLMKKEREADENKLNSLTKTKENLDKMADFETNLKELCAEIVPDLDNCNNDDKKDAYKYLDLKITATPEGAGIDGYINPRVLTTGRTSG